MTSLYAYFILSPFVFVGNQEAPLEEDASVQALRDQKPESVRIIKTH